MQARKIGILGTASTLGKAPFQSDWELWGVGPGVFPVLEESAKSLLGAWFELHYPETVKKEEPDYWEWLKTLECPVYMQREVGDIPSSKEYPRQEMLETFGKRFGGSSCWMTAKAIKDGATHIGYWGIHLSVLEEYRAEKPNLCYLMGLASGLGIQIQCFDALLPEADYGYS